IHAEHEEFAMGEVDHPQHAEDQREPDAHQRVDAADENAGEDELAERGHGARPPVWPTPELSSRTPSEREAPSEAIRDPCSLVLPIAHCRETWVPALAPLALGRDDSRRICMDRSQAYRWLHGGSGTMAGGAVATRSGKTCSLP